MNTDYGYALLRSALCRGTTSGTVPSRSILALLGDSMIRSIILADGIQRYKCRALGFYDDLVSELANNLMLKQAALRLGLDKVYTKNDYDGQGKYHASSFE